MEDNNTINNNEKAVEEDDDEEVVLKKRISSHPLYGLLVQAHIDCLKVGGIGDDEGQSHSVKRKKLPDKIGTSSSLRQPELDHFMEAYCLALSKLKEAMEEPQHQTVEFINSMHLQLRDLITPFSQSTHPSTSSSEGSDDNQNGQSAEFSF